MNSSAKRQLAAFQEHGAMSFVGQELVVDRGSNPMESQPTEAEAGRRQSSTVLSRLEKDTRGTLEIATTSGPREALKLAVIVLVPLVGVVSLASLNLIQASSSLRSARAMTNNLEVAEAIRRLVTMMQRERGMTCVLLNSVGYVFAPDNGQ